MLNKKHDRKVIHTSLFCSFFSWFLCSIPFHYQKVFHAVIFFIWSSFFINGYQYFFPLHFLPFLMFHMFFHLFWGFTLFLEMFSLLPPIHKCNFFTCFEVFNDEVHRPSEHAIFNIMIYQQYVTQFSVFFSISIPFT